MLLLQIQNSEDMNGTHFTNGVRSYREEGKKGGQAAPPPSSLLLFLLPFFLSLRGKKAGGYQFLEKFGSCGTWVEEEDSFNGWASSWSFACKAFP